MGMAASSLVLPTVLRIPTPLFRSVRFAQQMDNLIPAFPRSSRNEAVNHPLNPAPAGGALAQQLTFPIAGSCDEVKKKMGWSSPKALVASLLEERLHLWLA